MNDSLVATSAIFGFVIFAFGVYSIYRGFIGDSLLLTLLGILLTGILIGLFIYAFFSLNQYYKDIRAEKRKKNSQRSQKS